MGILDLIGEDLEGIDNILNGGKGWFCQLGKDHKNIIFEYYFGDWRVDYSINCWLFHEGDSIHIISENVVEKIKEICERGN